MTLLGSTFVFSAYIIGVVGWATSLKLGGNSPGIHVRDVSEAETRAQAQALLEHIPPHDKLHVDHLGGGERVQRLDIFNPNKQWKNAYTGIIAAYTGIIATLTIVAALLEAFTWYVVIKRRKLEESAKTAQHGASNGTQS